MPREAPVTSAIRSVRGDIVSLGLAGFSEQRELARRGVLRRAVGEWGRVFAGEAMIGELRPHRIAALLAHGAIDALDREEGERIGADEFAHAFEIVSRGQELVLL